MVSPPKDHGNFSHELTFISVLLDFYKYSKIRAMCNIDYNQQQYLRILSLLYLSW